MGTSAAEPDHSIEMAANRVAGANWLLPRIDSQYLRHLFYAGFVVAPRVQELQIDGLMLSIISSYLRVGVHPEADHAGGGSAALIRCLPRDI